jgi:amidase
VSADDAEKMDGGPVGLQIIGGRLQEEKVLALAEVLGGAVREVQAAQKL